MILCFRGRCIFFVFIRAGFNYERGNILNGIYASCNFHYNHTFLLFVVEKNAGAKILFGLIVQSSIVPHKKNKRWKKYTGVRRM